MKRVKLCPLFALSQAGSVPLLIVHMIRLRDVKMRLSGEIFHLYNAERFTARPNTPTIPTLFHTVESSHRHSQEGTVLADSML